jgi:hypothetical protein
LFPRDGIGNGYNLPKMHGMTKFQFYMKRYGSAMNFYGGTGESAHKVFVKAPGQKTQRRVSEFASQVATQYYNMIITQKAVLSVDGYDNSSTRLHCNRPTGDDVNYGDDVRFQLSGQYSLCINEILREEAAGGADIYPQWKTNVNNVKTNNYKFCLHPRLVTAIIKHVNTNFRMGDGGSYNIEGYTRLRTETEDGNRVIYYANPHILGRMWYDWAYVHFEEESANGDLVECFYPSKILGFVKFDTTTKAVIQCTERPLSWSSVERNFLYKVVLGLNDEISTVTVPLSSLVHPLCVIPDYGGDGASYFVIAKEKLE